LNKLLKIGIVDDLYFFRYGVIQALKQFEFADLVFAVETGKDFFEKQRINPAEVILLGIHKPVLNGCETFQAASREFPNLKFIILTMLDGNEYIDQFLKAGVHGYLKKNSDPLELETALKAVLNGQYYYCSEVLSHLRNHLNKASENSTIKSILTKRETEILHLIYEGYSNKKISEKLYISLFTAKNHRYKMKKKINAKNTAGLISFGIKNNILK
jgi:DNA-binding NarL/FixJ family response regulator